MAWDKFWSYLALVGLLVVLIGGGILLDMGLNDGRGGNSNPPSIGQLRTPLTPTATLSTLTPTTSTQQPTTSATTQQPMASSVAPTTSSVTPTPTGESIEALVAKLAQSISNFQCEMISSDAEDSVIRMWVKQHMMKTEATIFEDDFTIIIDSNNKTATAYSEAEKWGIYLPYEEMEEPMSVFAIKILEYSPTIIGYETVDGKACTIIEYTTTEDGEVASHKTWLWNQYGFPVKDEMTIDGKLTTLFYKNIMFNTVTDADFAIPSDIVFITL